MRALFLLVLFAFLKAAFANGDKGSLTISSPCDGHLTHKLPLNHSFERSDIIISGKCVNGVIFTVMSLGSGTIKGSVIPSSEGTLHISDGNPIYTITTSSRFEFLYRMIDTRAGNLPYKISLMKYTYSASSPSNKLQAVMVREHTSEDCKFPQIDIEDSNLCVLHLLLKKYSQNPSGSPNSKVEAIHLAELQNSASCYTNPVMCTSELHANKYTSEEDLINNFSCLFSESAKCVPVETGTQTEIVKVDAETQTPPVIITQTSTTANTLSKKELKKLEKEEKDRLRKQKKLLLQQEKERKKLEKQKEKEEKKALKEANNKSVSDEKKKKKEAKLLKQQEKQKKKEKARLLKQQEKEKQKLSMEEKQKQKLLDAEEKEKQKLLKKQEKERLRLQKRKEKEEQKLKKQKERADRDAAKAIEKNNKDDSSSSSCSSNKKTKSKATQTDVPTNVVLASVQTQTEDLPGFETNTEDLFVNEDIKIVDEDPKDDLPENTEEEQSNVEIVSISPSLTPIESSPSSTTTTTTTTMAPLSPKRTKYDKPAETKYAIGPFASEVVRPRQKRHQAAKELQSSSFAEGADASSVVVESKNLAQNASSEPSSSLEEILEDVSRNNLVTIVRDE